MISTIETLPGSAGEMTLRSRLLSRVRGCRSPIERICEIDASLLLGRYKGPPGDCVQLIFESFGLRVVDRRLPDSRLGELCLRTGEVRIDRAKQSKEEARVTLAHELGHWRLHRCLLEDGVELSQRHETQADLYASTLLLPWDLLSGTWYFRKLQWSVRRSKDLRKPFYTAVGRLAQIYSVPSSLVMERLIREAAASDR